VAAAYGLALGLQAAPVDEGDAALRQRFEAVRSMLDATRPTAVNLRWALERGREVFDATTAEGATAVASALLQLAHRLHADDIEANRRLAEHGAALFDSGERVLTHCNAGALATAGIGTALGVIGAAHRRGAVAQVWVDETRPLLQGARLTAWELDRLGVPHRVVTDSSVGALMARGLVDRVVVGADRVAANGDVANKIGTYVVAVLAARHGVPFYVAAPRSTLDAGTPSGDAIPIEERDGREITRLGGAELTPEGSEALNLAFDVTPNDLVAGIVTEVGVLEPPYDRSIARALADDT
ncbi:MAG: S-methyl-5-thioribose-1-phosphate isomerase, partial [Acidobacteriota bacterium]